MEKKRREGRMKTKQSIMALMAVALLLAVTAPALASVQVIGTGTLSSSNVGGGGTYNLIYDDGNHSPAQTPLIWLDYRFTGSAISNADIWAFTVNWVNNLTFDSYVLTGAYSSGYSINWTENNWRLPTTFGNPPASGYNQTGSELSHLYFSELGKTAGNTTYPNPPFTNFIPGWYWTSTVDAGDSTKAWAFSNFDGSLNVYDKTDGEYGYAVRAGQLNATAVPEPSTYALLCISLGVVGYARRKLKMKN